MVLSIKKCDLVCEFRACGNTNFVYIFKVYPHNFFISLLLYDHVFTKYLVDSVMKVTDNRNTHIQDGDVTCSVLYRC